MKVKLRKGDEYIEVDSDFPVDEIEISSEEYVDNLEDTLEYDVSEFKEEENE